VGVPINLMISAIMSREALPSKRGEERNISPITHPKAQISTFSLYSFAPNSSSGAR
jgi:hypothetical protein